LRLRSVQDFGWMRKNVRTAEICRALVGCELQEASGHYSSHRESRRRATIASSRARGTSQQLGSAAGRGSFAQQLCEDFRNFENGLIAQHRDVAAKFRQSRRFEELLYSLHDLLEVSKD
jgi:hypothetical protein